MFDRKTKQNKTCIFHLLLHLDHYISISFRSLPYSDEILSLLMAKKQNIVASFTNLEVSHKRLIEQYIFIYLLRIPSIITSEQKKPQLLD